MTLPRFAAVALVAMGTPKKKNFSPLAFPEGGLLSLVVYGANKDDKLIGRIKKIRSVHDCQKEGDRLIGEWDKGFICRVCIV